MVLLPPQTQNANPCLQGSGPFASSIFIAESAKAATVLTLWVSHPVAPPPPLPLPARGREKSLTMTCDALQTRTKVR